MKAITQFTPALAMLFRAADIGAYFAPLFRPMITEQDRLRPIRFTQQTAEINRVLTSFRRLQRERPLPG